MVIFESKPDARILDATASNRSIWRTKESTKIIWIDIEPELEIKPDLVLDCTQTGFPDNSIMMLIFDPPHWWGQKTGEAFFTCRNKAEKKKFLDKYNMGSAGCAYYGTDKFGTKTELLSFIHKAQKEFHRILYPDGVLWLNWSDVKLSLSKILPFFKDWDEMLRLPIGSKLQTLSDSQNWWVMFMKKDRPTPQTMMSAFMTNTDKEGES